MKIATYNIWNSQQGMPARKDHIIREIRKVNADVLCLQEVSDRTLAEEIAAAAGYPYVFFDHYPNEDEGLCIVSRLKFEECGSWMENSNSVYVCIKQNSKQIGVINLHLPWDRVKKREKQIVQITAFADRIKADWVCLAGDFNGSENADVHRFLTGECQLEQEECNPRWYDLAFSYAQRRGNVAECTLNFRKNPRFLRNTIEENLRADRILLRNPYPNDFPALASCDIFGETVYEETKLCASDHYGVVTEIL